MDVFGRRSSIDNVRDTYLIAFDANARNAIIFRHAVMHCRGTVCRYQIFGIRDKY